MVGTIFEKMTGAEKKKLQDLARQLKKGDEKIPSDTDKLLSFIESHILALKKHDSTKTKTVTDHNKRINQILDVLMAISNLDFTKKATISKNNDFIDGLATGVNMMGEELKASSFSLKEKETLLKEIHHRVKNNLQLVQSLLNIQSSYIEDENAYEKFRESIERVRSMALIHEKLYLSTDLSRIDFNDYIHSLVSHLFVSYNIDPDRIKVEVIVSSLHYEMDLNLAVPCGLIVNEMLTNCFKYAFPDNRKGTIKLTYRCSWLGVGKMENVITVEDDGIGFPENFKMEDAESLGMQLISTLAEQLDARIDILPIQGAGLSVSFITKDE